MFESLSDKLHDVFRKLRGQSTLTESNIVDAMREIRLALLDADVNGKRIWRLRIGPIAAAQAPELAARIAGLGFGQPQRVRD